MKNVLLLLSLLVTIFLGACSPGPDLNTLGAATVSVVAPPPFPTVTSFTPASGVAATVVTITGTDFAVTPTANTVKFGGIAAVVTAASTTSLTVSVPSLAPSGTITVTTTAGMGTSSSIFIVNGPGTLTGQVIDAASAVALAGVNVAVAASGVAATTTDVNGIYTVAGLPNAPYSLSVAKTGYITETISNFAVWANVTSTVETVHLVATPMYAGSGTVTGTIKNAFTGVGLPGVTLNFRSGINTTTGGVVATTTTGASGYYSISPLAGGNYTAEAAGGNYMVGAVSTQFTAAYFTVTSLGGLTNANQNSTINPTLPAGQTRIILTWGFDPQDLDSHLTGPLPGSASRFHVSYMNYGSSTAAPFAHLDVDWRTGYGPETTTIYTQTAGTYRFSVNDFTNYAMGTNPSFGLSTSGTKVRVYNSTGLAATFNAPANQAGTLWSVFELNGNTIIPIGTMAYTSNDSAIP